MAPTGVPGHGGHHARVAQDGPPGARSEGSVSEIIIIEFIMMATFPASEE